MAAQTDTLLRYRPWRGELHGPLWAALAMARASLWLMYRRWLYWDEDAADKLGRDGAVSDCVAS